MALGELLCCCNGTARQTVKEKVGGIDKKGTHNIDEPKTKEYILKIACVAPLTRIVEFYFLGSVYLRCVLRLLLT